MAMEKPKSPSDPAYLTKLKGVSGMSWLSAALCSLVVSAIVAIGMDDELFMATMVVEVHCKLHHELTRQVGS